MFRTLSVISKSGALRNGVLRQPQFNAVRNFAAVDWHGTTILCVRKNGHVVMGGDGQVSAGSSVVKGNARKVRRIGNDILVGFAGSTADAMSLLEKLEKALEVHPGQLMRACVELAKMWRSDKYLRRLEVGFIFFVLVISYSDLGHTAGG